MAIRRKEKMYDDIIYGIEKADAEKVNEAKNHFIGNVIR